MSAGPFEDGRYDDGLGHVYGCRVQPETKQLTLDSVANAYPIGTVTPNLPTIEISKRGSRGFGVFPRTVTIRLTADGTGAYAEYRQGNVYEIPVFTAAAWNGYAKTQTGTYLGIACVFVSKGSQEIK